MARVTSKIYNDDRWDAHIDIGQEGNVQVPLKYSSDHYTLELWVKLKPYPIIRKSHVQIPPTLVHLDPVTVTYTGSKLLFKDEATRQSVYVNYPKEQWFQLVITNGQPDTLGFNNGSIYINGKLKDTMIFPAKGHMLRIGNKLAVGDKIHINPNYQSESVLGLIRVYTKILSKHEIYNNYLAQAKRYGLVLRTEASVIEDALHLELIAKRGAFDDMTGHWFSTKQLLKREADALNKNPKDNYMSSELEELNNLLRTLTASQQAPHRAPRTRTCRRGRNRSRRAEVSGDIVILSRNPDMFMKNLTKKDDFETKQLITKGQAPTDSDYAEIFANPFKIKLLVAYLKTNPRHFMTLLKSNSLTQEQLIVLSNALNGAPPSAGSQADRVINAVVSQNVQTGGHYDAALELLNRQLAGPIREVRHVALKPVANHAPYLNNLVDSTEKIASIMEQNHARQEHQRRVASKRNLMNTLKHLNDRISNVDERSGKLAQLLAEHNSLLGLIVSKENGKCVGAIDRRGKINHCSRDKSPYDIMVNKDTYKLNLAHIMQQQQLHGATVAEVIASGLQVLGQCVNTKGITVGLIVRQGNANHYVPTAKSKPIRTIPILAILTPAQAKQCAQETDGRCSHGYKAVDEAAGNKNWLAQDAQEAQSVQGPQQVQAVQAPQTSEEIQPVVESANGAPLSAQAMAEEAKSRIFQALPGFGNAEAAVQAKQQAQQAQQQEEEEGAFNPFPNETVKSMFHRFT